MTDVSGRLVDVLRALPNKELNSLIERLGVRIDAAKRLDTPSQVARALVALPDLREPSRLPAAAVDLLHRVAEAKGMLLVSAVPPSLEPLLARGLMFARAGGGRGAVELVLPTAHLLQLRSWEGEDPRGVRALLAQASFETTSAIASHYLGRPATPPIVLALEPAWEVLSRSGALARARSKSSRRASCACSRRWSARAARSTPKSCSRSSASRFDCARRRACRLRVAASGRRSSAAGSSCRCTRIVTSCRPRSR